MLTSHWNFPEDPEDSEVVPLALLAWCSVPGEGSKASRTSVSKQSDLCSHASVTLGTIYCYIRPVVSGSLFLTPQAMPLEAWHGF